MERIDPALFRLVADARDHQEIARARRRDVRHADTFGVVGGDHLLGVVGQIDGRAPRDHARPKAALRVDVVGRSVRGSPAGRVAQHDDGELEALRFVHGGHADSGGAALDRRRRHTLTALEAFVEGLDERPEARGTVALEAPRELHDP